VVRFLYPQTSAKNSGRGEGGGGGGGGALNTPGSPAADGYWRGYRGATVPWAWSRPTATLGDPATHVFAISIFSTFKGPQYALTPSKTALTTAPTQVIVRCILKLPAHAQWQHWQRSRACARLACASQSYATLHHGKYSCSEGLPGPRYFASCLEPYPALCRSVCCPS